MISTDKNFICNDDFKVIIDNTPLVSLDLIVKKNNKILLGKRVNPPAKHYWFTLGGRVLKNETINNAIRRIAKDELGIDLETIPYFIGVFEHIYENSIFEKITTHYINLAYEIEIESNKNFPTVQHDEYKWFSKDELLKSDDVHTYTKDYFIQELGTIPQEKRNYVE